MDDLQVLLDNKKGLFIRQKKEWAEIIVDWETKNTYEILNVDGSRAGAVVERAGGFGSTLKRIIFRSHRPFEIDVFTGTSKILFHLSRNFFFFFSDLYITRLDGKRMGSVHKRFAFFSKKYDIRDEQGRLFARISSPIWRPWTFPVYGPGMQKVGEITKKWKGLLQEAFTDADQFYVDLQTHQWDTNRKAVVFAAAVSIDFDYFEDNQGSSGLLSFMGD